MVNSPYKVTIIVIYYLIRIRTFTCFRSMSFRCHRLNFIVSSVGEPRPGLGKGLIQVTGEQSDFKNWQRVWGEGAPEEDDPRLQTFSYQGCAVHPDEQNHHGCVISGKVIKKLNAQSSQHKENISLFYLFIVSL